MSKRKNPTQSSGSLNSKPAKKTRKNAVASSKPTPAKKSREFIAIPTSGKHDDEAVDAQDMLQEGDTGDAVDMASAAAFLAGIDPKQMSRSRKSIQDEWKKNKPVAEKRPSATTLRSNALAERLKTERKAKAAASGAQPTSEADEDQEDLDSDDLAFAGSDDDDLDLLSDMPDSEDLSDIDSTDLESDEDLSEDDEGEDSDEQAERAYAALRKRQDAQDAVEDANDSSKRRKLPTKLPDGFVQYINQPFEAQDNPVASTSRSSVKLPQLDSDESDAEDSTAQEAPRVADPLGPRFGRAGIKNLLQLPKRSERVSLAKSELATLSGDIMADPENSLNLLKRLLAFCDRQFSMGKQSQEPPLPIDQPVRALALLSLLAVYLDILPAYRIRERTEKEKNNKVSQSVARQHEYEAGLVGCYKRFLEVCERDVKDSSPLAPIALKCLCDLLKEKTQFNFATNIMEVLARHIGKPEWDATCASCLDAIVHVFQNDMTGSDSLGLVRMMSKTIKQRSFRVHPAMLASLLHIRLGDLQVRASGDRVTRDDAPLPPKSKLKDKKQPQQHISKKAKKAMKLKKEVEKEYAEAEMTVTAEERERDRTETLKILFALYFKVLKLDFTSPLLGPALEGLARFAHLINVDFFRDLLENLKLLVRRSEEVAEESKSLQPLNTRQQLLCVVTAFELLSGQGEALNIDLSDFVTALYSILLALSFSINFEDPPPEHIAEMQSLAKVRSSEAHLLFRALDAVFIKARATPPPGRCLAFSKRLLTCALHWPSDSALHTIQLVQNMLIKQPALEGMLTTEDMRMDGVYRPEANDPGLTNAEATAWYELHLLEHSHHDDRVRQQARALLNWHTA